jgi:hypothetical protein
MFTAINIRWDTVGNFFQESRIDCVSGAQYPWAAVL